MNDPLVVEALEPWDGVTWYYPKPEPGLRLMKICQYTAVQILRAGNSLTTADARLLQAIISHEGELTGTQRFWLTRLARDHDERVAA